MIEVCFFVLRLKSPLPYFTKIFNKPYFAQFPEREYEIDSGRHGNLKEIPKRYRKLISISLCGPGSNSF